MTLNSRGYIKGLRIKTNIIIVPFCVGLWCLLGYLIVYSKISFGKLWPLWLLSLLNLFLLLYVNIRWSKLKERYKKYEDVYYHPREFLITLFLYLSSLVLTFIIWHITPENTGMPKYIYFVEGGTLIYVFFKIGILIFDIFGFTCLLFWNEYISRKKESIIAVLIIWVIFSLAIVLDSKWR